MASIKPRPQTPFITLYGWLLFWFYSISTFVCYLTPNSVLFQTIQFSMSIQFKCQKTCLFQALQFSQTVLIQTIQFSISFPFVHTQLSTQKEFYFKQYSLV